MYKYTLILLVSAILPLGLTAQQQATVISRCGGTETVTIPTIIDADLDGMDDRLEQLLLNRFMPKLIQFSNENCPGLALNGVGDSNIIACRIYPIPQQYAWSGNYDSIKIHPVALVPSRGLVPGMIWYNPLVKVNTAVIYGQDCGFFGHTADVEGFNFSLKYIGPDTLAGWMYDMDMNHWMGDTIQSISHAGTLCQQVEVRPMKSLYFSWGADSIYASPDKHGNYLTIGGCGSSFFCNPGCGSAKILRHVCIVNLGEPNATLVTDMGNIYAAYAGNDPWTTANFLNAQGGNAGAIRDKMIMPLNSTFIHGQVLTAAQICPLYAHCFGPFAHAYSDHTCYGTPYQFHSRSLTQSGTYRDTLSASGCDSVVTLTLSVLPVDTYAYQAAVCSGSGYSFHGQMLTTAGTYHDTLSDIHGCDSMVTLHFIVHLPGSSSYSAVSCDSGYTFGSHVLGATGVYTDTLTGANGCDSVVTLSLIIDTVPAPTWSSGAADTVAAHSHAIALSGGSPVGGFYSGAGVVGHLFYPDSVAPGAHIVTYTYTDSLRCSRSVSRTIEVVTTGIREADIAAGILIYPNPASDFLTAESGLFATRDISISVSDVTGKVSSLPYTQHGQKLSIHIAPLAAGVYWVRFTLDGLNVSKRFVKAEL